MTSQLLSNVNFYNQPHELNGPSGSESHWRILRHAAYHLMLSGEPRSVWGEAVDILFSVEFKDKFGA